MEIRIYGGRGGLHRGRGLQRGPARMTLSLADLAEHGLTGVALIFTQAPLAALGP